MVTQPRIASGPALRMLAITYGVSWSLGLTLWLTGGIEVPIPKIAGGFAFMLGPAIGALIMTRTMSWSERRDALGLLASSTAELAPGLVSAACHRDLGDPPVHG